MNAIETDNKQFAYSRITRPISLLALFLMSVALSSVLPLALHPPDTSPVADYGFEHRNWSRIVSVMSIPNSLVVAGVFVWRSKSPGWLKAISAVGIVFGGSFVSVAAYVILCGLMGARDGFL
ncbi:MAG: hypothetical protein JST01_27940 [Cyanobacteria bacterium SZAS TMP-1]|nr:hypothetical protein [Cyanobacteria bacterium SZAS TMP-1]